MQPKPTYHQLQHRLAESQKESRLWVDQALLYAKALDQVSRQNNKFKAILWPLSALCLFLLLYLVLSRL